MKLPGFHAESSLGSGAGVYSRSSMRHGSTNEPTNGVVTPAVPRERWCQLKYWGWISHYFPVTICDPTRSDLGPVTTMAATTPISRQTPFIPRTARTSRPPTQFGKLQNCRVMYLPFSGEVTTTQNCEDSIPDTSALEVSGHPELKIQWTGGINEIPPPYNPGWFGFVNETCSCCGGKTECPDGSCIPPNRSCTQHQA